MAKKNKSKAVKNDFWTIITTDYVPYIIFAIVILIVYAKNLGYSFAYFDDDLLILNNLEFYKNSDNFWQIFSKDVFLNGLSAFYRPMQVASYFLDTQIFGIAPWGYFLSNIILHIIFTISGFILLQLFKIDKQIAFMLMLAYCVHPLLVHSVSWLPSRGDILLGIFCLLTMIYYIKFFKSNNNKDLLFFGISFFLAILSKESSILLPIILVLYYFTEKNESKNLIKQLIIPIVICCLLIGLYFVLRINAVNMNAAKETFDLMFIIKNLPALPELFFKFFIPVHLSPLPRFDYLITIGGCVIIILLIIAVVKSKIMFTQEFLVGSFWIMLFILPTLTFLHQMSTVSYQYLEHRAYIPFFGMLIILYKLFDSFKLNKYSVLKYLGVITVFFGIYSFIYANNYKNSDTFYGRSIELNKNDAVAFYNRGVARHRDNRLDEAFRDYDRALEIDSNYKAVYNNRGIINAIQGRTERALADFNKGIEMNPNFSDIYTNRGNAHLMLKDYSKAIKDYSKAIELNPGDAKSYLYRGNVYQQINNRDAACSDFKKAVDLGFKEAIGPFNKFCK
jgi:lipoprotein NlpI